MQRLRKADSASYRARGVAVRDVRHTHDGPEVSAPASKTKKDTKRWCRGKVGVAHKLHVVLSRREFFPRLLRCCSACGREFDTYSGRWGNAPGWASAEDLRTLQIANQQWRSTLERR